MSATDSFLQSVKDGYTFKGETILMGAGMLDGQVVSGASVYLPLKTMNRHGLIAGATGTGKTKTLQMISEALSDASVPVLLMDIKGDLEWHCRSRDRQRQGERTIQADRRNLYSVRLPRGISHPQRRERHPHPCHRQ
ncbi:helicase HerA-like domain-containing protein [Puia sp. P3]|uniref:helicase HerA-like domain-containing protein n=1 Tax=Puia sp. P3 TaxID=3423952 RepID=UPI003D667A8D